MFTIQSGHILEGTKFTIPNHKSTEIIVVLSGLPKALHLSSYEVFREKTDDKSNHLIDPTACRNRSGAQSSFFTEQA